MQKAFSLKYSLETVCVLLTLMSLALVFSEFVIGKHFIRPTIVLIAPLFLGNVARYGYRDAPWAKHVAFWIGVLLSAHWFFALFYAQTLREILGAAFLPITLGIFLILAFLTFEYRRKNTLSL